MLPVVVQWLHAAVWVLPKLPSHSWDQQLATVFVDLLSSLCRKMLKHVTRPTGQDTSETMRCRQLLNLQPTMTAYQIADLHFFSHEDTSRYIKSHLEPYGIAWVAYTKQYATHAVNTARAAAFLWQMSLFQARGELEECWGLSRFHQ